MELVSNFTYDHWMVLKCDYKMTTLSSHRSGFRARYVDCDA